MVIPAALLLASTLSAAPPAFRELVARNACANVTGVRIDRATADEVDLTVDGTIELPITHVPRAFPPHWIVRGKEVTTPEAALANELAAASDPWALLRAHGELEDGALARALCDLALATNVKGEYGRAASLAELALSIAREAAPEEAPRALWLIGRAHDSAYDEDGAIGPLTEARALAVQYGDKEIEARALINLAWVHLSTSDYNGAVAAAREGLAIAGELHDDRAAEEGWMALASGALDVADDPVQSLRYNEQALAYAERAGDLVIQAAINGNMGTAYDRMANDELATVYMRRAVELYRKAGNAKGMVRNLRNLADVEESMNRPDLAEPDLREIDRLLTTIDNPRTAAYAALTWVRVYLKRHELAAADRKSEQALQRARALHDPRLLSNATMVRSTVRFTQHRYAESIAIADDAIAQCMRVPNFDVYWVAKVQNGEAYAKLGRRAEARASLQDAIDAIEHKRANVPGSGEDEQRFLHDKSSAYQAMTRFALAGHDVAGALHWIERARARTLLQQLASAKLRSTRDLTAEEQREDRQADEAILRLNVALREARLDDKPDARRIAELERELQQRRIERADLTARLYRDHPQLSLVRGDIAVPTLDELQQAIPENGVVLEYTIDEFMGAVIAVTRHGAPRVFPIRATAPRLTRIARAFTRDIAARRLDYQPSARRLYDLLLRPAESVLRAKSIVCIITDTPVAGLPFQALLAPDGRHFIEQHPLFYAPSLALLVWHHKHPQRDSVGGERMLLAVGNPQLSGETVRMARAVERDENLRPLPDAEREVRQIARLFDPRETLLLTGAAATESRVKREAGRFRIIHLATHGMFDDHAPMYSHVVLARGPNDADDGLLEAREIAALDLHADLTILSGCETARGYSYLGEGMIGISWALLAAGCPRSVLTQWKIASAPARELMVAFHRHLGTNAIRGRDVTQSLRAAQLEMLRQRTLAHPYYWSAFIVVGDGW
jgi:CHAT domain-containing protein